MNKSVLAIIPARGGSKGIPNKNIVELAGRPLLAYTLQALGRIKHKVEHIVSTDDEEIRRVAQQYGGYVPFLRPTELAKDDTNIVAVIDDILSRMGRKYEYVLLLQPTAPLRSSADIDAALELAFVHDADSVCSFMKVDSYHPYYMYYVQEDGRVKQVVDTKPGARRQDFPEALWRNGAIYLFRTAMYQAEKKFISDDCVPYVMPPQRSVNIDGYDDLELAEYYLKNEKRKVKSAKQQLKIKSI